MQRGINHQLWPTLSSIQLEVPYNVTLLLWLLKLHDNVMVVGISFSDQYSIMVPLNEQTLMKMIRLFFCFFVVCLFLLLFLFFTVIPIKLSWACCVTYIITKTVNSAKENE